MLAEFVSKIGELAVRAKEARIITDPRDPRRVYLLHDGSVQELQGARRVLQSRVLTLEALWEAVREFAGRSTSIWHDYDRIVALLDHDDRYEMVTLPLQESEQLSALRRLHEPFDQRKLVLWLKRRMEGAIEEGIIGKFRAIDFSRREQASSAIYHGDESLGRSVHAEIENRSEIPEFLTCNVPIYRNPGLVMRRPIKLSVDIDTHNATITLAPLADEITAAILATQMEIGELLAGQAEAFNSDADADGTMVRVFFGSCGFESP